MSNSCLCDNCGFLILTYENNQNKLYILNKAKLETIKKIVTSTQEKDKFGEPYSPFYEGILVVDDFFWTCCPNCNAIHIIKNGGEPQFLCLPEAQAVLPRPVNVELDELERIMQEEAIRLKEDYNYPPPQTHQLIEALEHGYFKHQPIPDDIKISCGCSKEILSSQYDQLGFYSCLTSALIEIEDEKKYRELLPSERMKYLLSISFRIYMCKECDRMICFGRSAKGDLFQVVYKKTDFKPSELE